MFTLEEKINIALAYIATDDEFHRRKLKSMAAEAIKDIGECAAKKDTPESAAPNTRYNYVYVEDVIEDVLKDIGVPCYLAGYDALAYAIKLVVSDPIYKMNFTIGLYQEVARHVNSTPSRVERVMRHATEVAMGRCDIDIIEKFFGNTMSLAKDKPTNRHMIIGCAKEVQRRLKARNVEV